MTTPRASSPTDFSPPSVSAIRLKNVISVKIVLWSFSFVIQSRISSLRRYRETTPKVVINVGGLRHEVPSLGKPPP